jgi:hypothetical protein
MWRFVLFSALGLFALQIQVPAHANSIGVNFTATSFGGGPYPILANESAGLVPQANWNNTNPLAAGLTPDVASPVAGKLVDNTGAITTANVVWLNGNSAVNSNVGNTTPNERLYRGTVEGLGVNHPALEVAMFDVPYTRYNVIAYLAGFGFQADASITLGNQQYYYIQSSNFTTDGFKKATATTLATQTLATYAEFDNLTSSSFVMQILTTSGNRGSIAGFQVVGVPEPSALMLALCGGLALIGWRFRSRRAIQRSHFDALPAIDSVPNGSRRQ